MCSGSWSTQRGRRGIRLRIAIPSSSLEIKGKQRLLNVWIPVMTRMKKELRMQKPTRQLHLLMIFGTKIFEGSVFSDFFMQFKITFTGCWNRRSLSLHLPCIFKACLHTQVLAKAPSTRSKLIWGKLLSEQPIAQFLPISCSHLKHHHSKGTFMSWLHCHSTKIYWCRLKWLGECL